MRCPCWISSTCHLTDVANMLFSDGACEVRVVAGVPMGGVVSKIGEIEVAGCRRLASRATSKAESSIRCELVPGL